MTNSLPKHVAVIMDGNGRWAKRRHLPRVAGHRAGAKAVRRAVEFAVDHQLDVLTLFALSTENNLYRPPKEVQLLMTLFLEALQSNTAELHENNVSIRILGDRSALTPKLLRQVEYSESLTKDNTGLKLVIAINYSGRWDITQAAKRLAIAVAQGQLSSDAINEDLLQHHLAMPELPDPDLLIRTSGELRISNFLLWQFAYTEFFFTDTYWPDFNADVFTEALQFYQSRQRRFGKVAQPIEQQHA